MSNKFVVVSFYTLGDGYEKAAKERLIPSLEAHDVPYFIQGVQGHGNWGRNILMKSAVILNAMEQAGYSGENIVWLDADAELCQYPTLFEELADQCDFAYHRRFGRNLSSGTMFFRNKYACRQLVEHWNRDCDRELDKGGRRTEQALLKSILPVHNVSVYDLPRS